MKFEVFKNLEQTANQEAQDITRFVESRIAAERKQAATRATELSAIIGDPARSETIRRKPFGAMS